MEKKYCKICGKEFSKNCKTGYCIKHLPRNGENNPFFGKTHKKDTIENMKKKCSEASKKLWENDEYRNKVISNVTGVKRSEDFKETQRNHALKQFENEEQKRLRSKIMHDNWQNGTIIFKMHESINESKEEKEFIGLIEKLGYKISFNSFLYEKNDRKRHLFPDGIIEDEKIIIEYNGSFWHADPSRGYKDSDIIHHGITAKEIWDRDLEKIKTYESNGYYVFTVWSDSFLMNKNKCVEKFIKFVEYVRNQRKIL